ncbi:MAG: nicotinate (nicotinamide) nucleotide adenylyltransferase [Gemmatimonadetes bacterium]|nr:nicotinate (nicotinamide) nucleotide adenylyltransferase [Gemmatimonadota bacterium]
MRLGVFGGSFDPPHLGHLIVAQDAALALSLDRVLFVPAAVPPHKRGQSLSAGEVRLEMTRAAIAGNPLFEASDVELTRTGPSYTIETLRELVTRTRGDAEELALFLLMGVDQFREFHTWREPEEIARLASLAVFARAGEEIGWPGVDVAFQPVPVTRVDVSSTDIRRRVAAGEPIRYLVPPGVEEIIRREGLYQG